MDRGSSQMTDEQKTWVIARNHMMKALESLGFPEALGEQIVKNLGSPRTAPDLVSGEPAGFEASIESVRILTFCPRSWLVTLV